MARPSLIDQLGMPDRSGDEKYFSRLMKPKVTKEQFQERARAARQKKMPQVRKGAKMRLRKQRRAEQMLAELFTDDLITGGPGMVPGEGLIPYGAMPEAVRRQIPLDAPPIGWDPSKLTPAKRMLLRRLQMMGQREMQMRQDPAVMGPPAP